MFRPLFGFKISQTFNLRNKVTNFFNFFNFFCNPRDFYLPAREKITPPYTSQDLTENLINDQLWVPLL
jgi:hypothetical protein